MTISYEDTNSEILALFAASGKDKPTIDSSIGQAVRILQKICDSQDHTISMPAAVDTDTPIKESQALAESDASHIFDALNEIAGNVENDDFTLEFDGNEYRLINENAIWDIYVKAIKNIVNDCYDLKLDDVPSFVALSIDWEKTAQNAFVDGYGHTFSGYDGSEELAANYYIFRTN